MSKKQPAQKDRTAKANEPRDVAGYPEEPLPLWAVIGAAVAWGLWIGFLLIMAYIRQTEWPI